MSGLVHLTATCICQLSCRNGYPRMLVLHLLPLQPLTHCWIIASLNLFCRYYLGRCSSGLAELVPLPNSCGRSFLYSNRLHDFSVTILRCYKNVYVSSFFPHTARHWNYLPAECFPLTCDLNGFKSRGIKTPFFFGFSLNNFPICFFCFSSFSCNSVSCSNRSALHGVNPNYKKDMWIFKYNFSTVILFPFSSKSFLSKVQTFTAENFLISV